MTFNRNFFIDPEGRDLITDYRFTNDDEPLLIPVEDRVLDLDQKWKAYVSSLEPIKRTANYRKYTFHSFYHSYVCTMIKQLNRYGIDGLLDPKTDTEAGEDLLRQSAVGSTFNFKDFYEPENNLVDKSLPEEGFDFDFDGPYGIYNWELFFHGPMLIASKLTQNQKFEDAQKWLHYVFNPTETEGTAPERFWKVKPFFEQQGGDDIQVVLDRMASGDKSFNRQLDQWMRNPFQPHVIARLRIVAYMKSVVTKYVDNLIKWGDQLFRRDSIESINEATQLYILASQILGPRPVEVEKESPAPRSVEEVLADDGNFNTALVDLESEIGSIETDQEVDLADDVSSLNSILFFCTSPNEKLLAYWDVVSDRLFKIRNCQNIEGVERTLALFEPPIDPALLVRASAAGLSIGDVLGNISGSTLPHYRFRVLIQKANELCNDVKNLGQSLLSVLEKKDAEELAILRASQEVSLLKAIREIRKQTINENKENLASLENARELSDIRRQFYSSREFMNSSEKEQLKRLEKSKDFFIASQATSALAAILSLSPNIEAGVAGAFGSPFATVEGGGQLAYNALTAASGILTALSSIESQNATKAGIKGGYERRKDDWELQAELAEKEIEQVTRQIAGAEIRLALSERELENHDLQIEQSREVESFMKDKYTSRDLYNWMITQVSGIYFQSYQLAYDVGRMAELAYGHELAQENTSFIKFDNWDSLRKGLLAGERLQTDLRRMEVAYLEQNKREFELTKNISLSLLAPSQLINLRENGVCDIQIPEVLFDLDYPGQYMRRIKSVRLTIPAVTGPYTNVNAKLTLLSNRIRKNTERPGEYAFTDGDNRFREQMGGVRSIATSSAQNDSGTFELNFQDERYLPFEGAGAVSSWRLELTSDFRQFDYDTISDVIISMNYTAREGGSAMKAGANSIIQDGLNAFTNELVSSGESLQRVFSWKTHFPNDLYQLLLDTGGDQEATISIRQEHFPYYLVGRSLNIEEKVTVMIKPRGDSQLSYAGRTLEVLQGATSLGVLTPLNVVVPDPPLQPNPPLQFQDYPSSGSPIDSWTLRAAGTDVSGVFNNTDIEDIYLVVNYTIS